MKKPIEGAKNILKEGLKIISSGTGDYTDGDGVRSSDTQLSMKSEAQPISFAVGGQFTASDALVGIENVTFEIAGINYKN